MVVRPDRTAVDDSVPVVTHEIVKSVMVRDVVQQLPGGNQVKRFRAGVLIAALSVSILAVACGRSGSDSSSDTTSKSGSKANAACTKEALQATEIGVTADTISIEVMADTGSALAPGLFQANIDAVQAFAKWANANGGIGCRQVKVDTWDSKLDPTESKNGILNACKNDLAMVGGNSLFNPDTTDLGNCADKAGQPVGLPDFAALANDVHEQCAPTAWILQAVAEDCSKGVPTGERDLKAFKGQLDYYKTVQPNLKGVWLVPGDLPTTVQSATYQIAAAQQDGITVTDQMKVSGRSEQSAFATYVQALKAGNGNFLYNGSNDVAMIKMRKEAAAQGLTGVNVWSCSLACYTQNFRDAGSAVDGTYVWMQYIPFEEASSNAALKTYVDAVGGKPDSFGAQAWQSAMAFKQAVDEIVAEQGANAITRPNLLAKMKTLSFDADGWIGKRTGQRVFSDCQVVMQINNGKFERVFPKEAGTLDCKPANITTVKLDPAQAATQVK